MDEMSMSVRDYRHYITMSITGNGDIYYQIIGGYDDYPLHGGDGTIIAWTNSYDMALRYVVSLPDNIESYRRQGWIK